MDIKAYFEQLNTRERNMLIVAGVLLAFYLFYALIYSPLANAVASKKMTLAENKSTLLWMEDVYGKHHGLKQPEVLTSEKLLTLLSNQLKASKFKNTKYQIEQTNTGDISISFQDVSYNELMKWLWNFCGKHALSIKQFTATSKRSAGVVSATVVLSQV